MKEANIKLKSIKIDYRKHSMLIALVFISVLFQMLTGGVIFKSTNLTKLIMQNSYLLILAIGMLPCIITGNVDLSVGSIVTLISALCGELIINQKFPISVAVIIALSFGIVIGAFQGYWIAFIRIPAFIVTLAGMLIFRGFAMVILQGKTLAPFPKEYSWISAGYLPQYLVGKYDVVAMGFGLICFGVLLVSQLIKLKRAKMLNMKSEHPYLLIIRYSVIGFVIVFLSFWLGTYNGLPTVLLLLVALTLIYTFITNKTVIGRRVYAFGGNERAAKLSGINTNLVLFITYVNMAFMASIAAIVFSGRLTAATPTAGVGFELDAIASCYIGGASATGGVGTVIGAVIGGLVMGILNNGMSIMGIGSDWQQTIKGFVLLLAVAFDLIGKRKH